MEQALAPIEVGKIRGCGGNIADVLFKEANISTMGQVKALETKEFS